MNTTLPEKCKSAGRRPSEFFPVISGDMHNVRIQMITGGVEKVT